MSVSIFNFELQARDINQEYLEQIVNEYGEDLTNFIDYIKEAIENVDDNCNLTIDKRRIIIRIARALDDKQEEAYSGCKPDANRTKVNLADDLFELYLVLKYWENKKDMVQGVKLVHDAWSFSKCWNIFADDMENFTLEWNKGEFKYTEENKGFANFKSENIIKQNRRLQLTSFYELPFEEQVKDVDTLRTIVNLSKEDLSLFAGLFGIDASNILM